MFARISGFASEWKDAPVSLLSGALPEALECAYAFSAAVQMLRTVEVLFSQHDTMFEHSSCQLPETPARLRQQHPVASAVLARLADHNRVGTER